jgi:hypothetical protein
MAAGWVVEYPLEEAFLEIPVCVSVECVVVHLLQVAHQLNVWVSVFFVVDAPGAVEWNTILAFVPVCCDRP